MQNLSSLIRACKYSYEPNKLGYCGPEHANEIFLSFIQNPSEIKAEEVKQLLMHFPALYPYLELIARKNNLKPFDSEVIDAYWTGNKLLEKVERKDVEKLILTKFSGEGLLPKKLAEEKAANLPSKVFISHAFHVLYMNFITKKIEPILKNLDSCLVKGAEINDIKKDSFSVKTYSLLYESGEFKLKEKKVKIGKGFAENASKGGLISIHWNSAVEIISEDELDSIRTFTEKNLAQLLF